MAAADQPQPDKEAAQSFLQSLLNKKLRIHTTDERMFWGDFKCTDPVGLCSSSLLPRPKLPRLTYRAQRTEISSWHIPTSTANRPPANANALRPRSPARTPRPSKWRCRTGIWGWWLSLGSILSRLRRRILRVN